VKNIVQIRFLAFAKGINMGTQFSDLVYSCLQTYVGCFKKSSLDFFNGIQRYDILLPIFYV